MKPITDDMVFTILKGLEQRESKKKKPIAVAKAALPDRVLGSLFIKHRLSFDIAKQRTRETMNELLCYAARD